jgi:glycosyltransferase involved in cell wall biosynthesis
MQLVKNSPDVTSNGTLVPSETTGAQAHLVSVVIPCYRGAPFLAEAIDSCIRQTYANLEILVVDDCSPDNCAEIAASYAERDPRVRLIRRNENGGVSEAFNTGFRAAAGKYHTRLAQDDVFQEDAVERMVGALENRNEVDLVYCDYQAMDSAGSRLYVVRVAEPNHALAWKNGIGLCVMWRRDVWEKIGAFDKSYDAAEDYDYWLRVSRHFQFDRCEGMPAMLFRIHPDMGSTRFAARQEAAIARLLRRSFDEEAAGPARWIRYCKGSSYHAYSFAPYYSAVGRDGKAVIRLLHSFLLWPIPLTGCGIRTSCARGKLLVKLLLRVFGISRKKSEPSLAGTGSTPIDEVNASNLNVH